MRSCQPDTWQLNPTQPLVKPTSCLTARAGAAPAGCSVGGPALVSLIHPCTPPPPPPPFAPQVTERPAFPTLELLARPTLEQMDPESCVEAPYRCVGAVGGLRCTTAGGGSGAVARAGAACAEPRPAWRHPSDGGRRRARGPRVGGGIARLWHSPHVGGQPPPLARALTQLPPGPGTHPAHDHHRPPPPPPPPPFSGCAAPTRSTAGAWRASWRGAGRGEGAGRGPRGCGGGATGHGVGAGAGSSSRVFLGGPGRCSCGISLPCFYSRPKHLSAYTPTRLPPTQPQPPFPNLPPAP